MGVCSEARPRNLIPALPEEPVKLTDDVKQRKQKHFKQYRTAKQKLTNKENLVRFLHRGKPLIPDTENTVAPLFNIT